RLELAPAGRCRRPFAAFAVDEPVGDAVGPDRLRGRGVPRADPDPEAQLDDVPLRRALRGAARQGPGRLALHDLPPRAHELADLVGRDGDDLLRRLQVLLDVVRLVQPVEGEERRSEERRVGKAWMSPGAAVA